MTVPIKILESTKHCEKNFKCLNNPNCRCEVTDCINGELLFVNFTYKGFCEYEMDFGGSSVCNCPTSKCLHNKENSTNNCN